MPEVPFGYCQCGCGEKTRLAANSSNGNTKGEPQRYLLGHRVTKTAIHNVINGATWKRAA